MILTAETRLLRDGLNMRLVEQRGDEIDWACDRTRQRFTCTHAELATLIAAKEAEFLTVDGGNRTPAAIDPTDVAPARRADAEHKLEYVLDMQKASLTHRPALRDFEAQIQLTASRLGDETPPESWTVKRWLSKSGANPSWPKLLDKTERKGNRGVRLTPDQLAIVNEQIDERYLSRTRISVEGLMPYVRNAIRLANLQRPSDDRIQHVGRRSVVSAIALREPREIHAARFGEQAAKAKFNRVDPQADPVAPLDRIEIDHTVADLFVVSDEDGLPIGRPTVGFAIDRCTRMPFGLYIGFEPESVLSVMQILKNGIFPKTYVTENIRTGEWDFQNDWPVWGMPRSLVFDRGMAGLSHDLRQAALEIGIRDISFMATRSGHQKGAIERFFRTQNQRLLHEQKGSSFSNVIDRGDYDAAANAVISFSTFVKMTHRYLVDIYARAKHSGLGNETPASAWSRLIERHPSEPVLPIADMIHLFTRDRTVSLRREGVRLNHIFYNSDELDAERLSADFAAKSPKGKVLMRYDPADLGCVWVRLPHRGGRYLRVPPTSRWSEYAPGKSIWEHIQTSAHHREIFGHDYDPDSLAAARVALSGDAESSRKRKVAHSKRNARLNGVGRTSPAGLDSSTTPKNSAHGKRMATTATPSPANDGPPTKPIGVRPIGRDGVKKIAFRPRRGPQEP